MLKKRKSRRYLAEGKHINESISSQLRAELIEAININSQSEIEQENSSFIAELEGSSQPEKNFSFRLAQWLIENNISRLASNSLLSLLSDILFQKFSKTN